jgi:hypothetical protein
MHRPERRNRNIGTASSGYKKSNWMRVPESWTDKHGDMSAFWSRVSLDNIETFPIQGETVSILYETLRVGYTYGSSPADVIHICKKSCQTTQAAQT